MVLTPEEMAAAEEALFAAGAEAEPLMDRAGRGIAEAAMQFCPKPGIALAFVGDGHNGGDALVALRHLREAGWRTGVRIANSAGTVKPLTDKKLEQLGGTEFDPDREQLSRGQPLLLIDGLLGIGARGELRPAYRAAADALNAYRTREGGFTVAVDIPSGLDGVTGEPYPGAVIADLTCTITYPKTGLLADAAANHVGRLALVPLDDIVVREGDGDSNALLITARELSARHSRRAFDTHKGNAGRVGIIGGSPGLTGAAVLCATAALRGGAGLVTLFADKDTHPTLAAAAPPEIMVRPIGSLAQVTDFELDALAIGPGLGNTSDSHLSQILLNDPRPAVLDADALNLLARSDHPAALRDAAGPRLLTPHPGEMARLELAGGLPVEGLTRRERAERMARDSGATILLKGARTVVASPGHEPTAFNSTGGPAMATGGVGDTLTGLIAALAAGGASLYDAACIGAWINGRAAEIALCSGGQSVESLAASDLTQHFGSAFRDLRSNVF